MTQLKIDAMEVSYFIRECVAPCFTSFTDRDEHMAAQVDSHCRQPNLTETFNCTGCIIAHHRGRRGRSLVAFNATSLILVLEIPFNV